MSSRDKDAVGYVRVSTDGQAQEGVSLDAQREHLRAWCRVNGYTLTDIHEDAGLSGRRAANRPGLMSALAESTAVRGRALVVYSLSRIARSTKDMLEIADRLERSGADLVSLTERIDTTSAAGRMVFRMLAVLAEFERDLIAERTRSALALKRARGECVGQVPFGYQRAGKLLAPDTAAARTRAAILALREQGLSLRAIAAHLTQQGAVTTMGSSTWHPTTVRRVLAQKVA